MDTELLFKEMEKLSSGDNLDALEMFIAKNQFLLKEDPIRFIGLHISYYSLKEDVISSLKVVSYYQNAPYISQEVEEFLHELDEKLRKLLMPKKDNFDQEKIKKMLFSQNENALSSAMSYLSKQNIRLYIPLVQEFLLSNVCYKYKTLMLFILIEQKYDQEIKLKKDGRIFSLNPSQMVLPFEDEHYQECLKLINEKTSRQELIQVVKEIINTIQIKDFPSSFLDGNLDFFSSFILEYGKTYLQEMPHYEILLDKFHLQKDDLESLKVQIEEVMNS